MGTTAEKLQKILDTKSAIKQAIINKGVAVSDTDTFASYAEKIGTLEVAKGEEEKTLALSMANGNQVITPTSGKVMNKVTITKPSTLIPENIKSGVDIGGVVGTYVGSSATYWNGMYTDGGK